MRSTGLPNYLSARVPVPSGLIMCNWRWLLKNYYDSQLSDFLEFLRPSDYTGMIPSILTSRNHNEPAEHNKWITKFIHTEIEHSTLLGPFTEAPFHPWAE